jgi:uncharacterized repeat protein (TIGR03803 family)
VAYTEQVIYSFDPSDHGPKAPNGPLFIGPDGAYYGTTYDGGVNGAGVAYKLTASRRFSKLHDFGSGYDGAFPETGVIRDASGNLYGTTFEGGDFPCFGPGCGTVFELVPSASGYTESVLHNFKGYGHNDGSFPEAGLTMDASGNLYGTTYEGGNGQCYVATSGADGCGTVFKLTKTASGYTYSEIYGFDNGADGAYPVGGVAIDSSGNIFGTTADGGHDCGQLGCGTVFKLAPSGPNYTKTTIYQFNGKDNDDGAHPESSVILDSAGNVYGTTYAGGSNCGSDCSTEYKLIPCTSVTCSNPYTEAWLYTFGASSGSCGYPDADPSAPIEDADGNLYGTLKDYGSGAVFESNALSGSTSIIYTFSGSSDGECPGGSLVIDGSGNLDGVMVTGGSHGDGLIYSLSDGSRDKRTRFGP